MAFLSVDSVNDTIDSVLSSEGSTSNNRFLRFAENDWNRISSPSDTATDLSVERNRPPYYFGIQILEDNTTVDGSVGFCTFYVAYSTWDGRMLYVDQIKGSGDAKFALYQVLAKIAVRTGCLRFTWKQKDRPEWNNVPVDPEYLEDWIFLSMDRAAMATFIDSSLLKRGIDPQPKPLNRQIVEGVIRETLGQQSSNVRLRLAGPDDVETIARLVNLLAVYENEADAVKMTAKDYWLDGFQASTEPLFYCVLADVPENEGSNSVTTVAMGLFYFGHSMEDGRFLYLEDLFCEQAFRGKGVGTAIMKQLAKISLALDCHQFLWTALDWNAPALSFYHKIGATVLKHLKITRYCGENLRSFAEGMNAGD